MGQKKKWTIEFLQSAAAERGGKCLSPQYIAHNKKLKWQCEKGHTWEATPDAIVHMKSWCRSCASKKRSIEEMQETAKSRGGKCLSTEYVDIHTHLTWECAYGHIWQATPVSIIHLESWCPKCRGKKPVIETSFERAESAIREYAKRNGWPSKVKWNKYAKEIGVLGAEGMRRHIKTSWEKYREKLGFPPRRQKFTKEECLEAIKKASESLGQFFTGKEYNEWKKDHTNLPTEQQVSWRWGSWNMAKTAAGLVPNVCWGKEFTEKDAINALRACSHARGPLFSEKEYMSWRGGNPDLPHIETIRKWVGGLPEAKRKIGLEAYDPGPPEPQYTDGRWREPFLRFLHDQLTYDAYGKWLKENSGPDPQTLSDHIGGYNKALLECLCLYIEKIESGRRNR